jgi:hypothetical protein
MIIGDRLRAIREQKNLSHLHSGRIKRFFGRAASKNSTKQKHPYWIPFRRKEKRDFCSKLLARISILKVARESSRAIRHLYLCGFERVHSVEEVHTQWVKNKSSPFSSLSTPSEG